MNRQLISGDGWRLGWNPSAEQFCALVGAEHWSVELTEIEFQDFCRLSQQLQHTMASMAAQLMDEERLTCEQETQYIWMEVEGFPTAFGLRFILLSGRRAEGEWSADATGELLSTLRASSFGTDFSLLKPQSL